MLRVEIYNGYNFDIVKDVFPTFPFISFSLVSHIRSMCLTTTLDLVKKSLCVHLLSLFLTTCSMTYDLM